MTDQFDAEERAFRDALREAGEAESFDPIDAAELPRQSARSRGWTGAVAAAVVIGVVGLVGAVVLPYLQAAGTSTTAGAAPEAPQDAATAEAGPEMAPAPARENGLDAPQPGFRWESFRDVVVQVPQDWGYGHAPTSAWCISEDWPQTPYVDLARGSGMVPAILCEGVMPADKLVPHLVFSLPDGVPPERLADGWTYHTRQLGSVTVSVATDADRADLADQILATATVVAGDHNGCPVSAPEADGGGLTPLSGAPIVFCLYDSDSADAPGLRASVALDGDAAGRAWDAIAAAPTGGGPDASAATCSELPPGTGEPVGFLLVDGRAFRFEFSGCTGNGLSDPSPQAALREITPDLCRALLVPPVWINSGSGPAAEVCLMAVARP